MSTPNAAKAWAVMDLIDQHREALNMDEWATRPGGRSPVSLTDLLDPDCGTTACFAGWTAAVEGFEVDVTGQAWHADGRGGGWTTRIAAEVLGLDDTEASALFYETFDEELTAAVTRIFGPRPE